MKPVHGLLASFADEAGFLVALTQLRSKGFVRVEAYTPYYVEEAYRHLPRIRSPIPLIMGIAGALGGTGGFFLQWWAAHDFPLDVGGRPLGSWPAFIPITFELTVLTSALVGLASFLIIARFPRLDHPLFAEAPFGRASQDRFFVCVRSDDPNYEVKELRSILEALHPDSLEEVPE